MFIRTLEDVRGTDRYKVLLNGALHSARYIVAADGMGFSLHVNRSKSCPPMTLWYKNHWETNYILSGTGLVEDLNTGESWKLEADIAYNVGPKDRHRLSAHTDLHLVSVFCPPLEGNEQHDADGALEPSGPVPPGY